MAMISNFPQAWNILPPPPVPSTVRYSAVRSKAFWSRPPNH